MSDTATPPPVPAPPQPPKQSQQDIEKKLDDIAEKTKEKMHQDPTTAQTLAATPALQDEVVEIEKELLGEIVKRMETNNMSQEETQKLAKEFLSLLPIQDQKDLLEKLKKFSQTNSAAQGIYLKYAKENEESETQRKLELMTQHIQTGNIEQALAVAKGGTQNV